MAKLIYVCLALFVAHFALVQGHGWMTSPTPANYQGDNQNSASQQTPCGFGIGPENITIPRYGNLPAGFTIGGGHQDAICTIAFANNVNETLFDQNIKWEFDCPSPSVHEKSLFITQQPGTYFMRWRWSGWLACAQLTVTPAEVDVTPISVGQEQSGTVSADAEKYYELSIEANKFVLLEFSGPENTVFGASQNQLPMKADADLLVTSNGEGSLCSDGEASTAIVGYFAGSTTGAFSIKSTTYTGLLDYVNEPEIDTSVTKATTRIFGTDAFDTDRVAKRIVVRATGGDGDLGITPMGIDCTTDVQQPAEWGDIACANVGSNENRKFYKVYTTGAVDFTASIEDGTCANIKNSNGIAMKASLVLIASFIVALF